MGYIPSLESTPKKGPAAQINSRCWAAAALMLSSAQNNKQKLQMIPIIP